MPFSDPAPPASASASEHADWLELKALSSDDRNSSISDLARAIKRAGSIDALASEDEDESTPNEIADERTTVVTSAAFDEIERRDRSCKPSNGYAFTIHNNYIEAKGAAADSIYVFLLLLSRYGHQAIKGQRVDGLFEEVAAAAVRSYLGGSATGASAIVFGPTRRSRAVKGFKAAIGNLCIELGEGGGVSDQPAASDQKDAKLDIVAWRAFADRRAGKLIAFGQCATGGNWENKLQELLPKSFCDLWLKDRLYVEPARLFFIPFTVPDRTWPLAISRGGILFDRCRIAAHVSDIHADVISECKVWSQKVIEQEVLV